ncbi:chitinase [Enterococcus faecium]|nr:chitinase [Enterococcus faecium]
MKKTNISNLVVVGLCIVALTGCGSNPEVKPNVPNSEVKPHTSKSTVNSVTNEKNINDSSENAKNDFLNSADLQGDVLEFTDSGCSIKQAKVTDGGAGLQIEANGMENKDNAVSVTYTPTCEFVVATINAQSGVKNISTSSISDVKKNSSVYLFGEFADKLHFNAIKVVIARWE